MTGATKVREATAPARGDRPRRRRVLLAVVLLVVGWAAATAVLVVGAAVDLRAARTPAEDGRAALADADPGAAAARLADAAARLERAERRLSSPLVWPLRGVPGVRANIRAATALAAATHRAAEAGVAVASELRDLPGGIGALAPADGTVPLAPLERLAPALADADTLLAEARALAQSTPRRGLVRPLAEARDEVTPLVVDAADAVSATAALARALPAFLGADGPRRYFVGASNPAELRGTGGLIGAYTILDVDGGRLSLRGFAPIQDLPDVDIGDIEPPSAEYAARYNRYGGAGFWKNINLTPHFPSAAEAIERLHAQVTGEPIDGTILVDPLLLSGLLALTGPAEVPGGGTVDADTVVGYVANEAYGEIPRSEERKELLGAVAATALDRLLRGDVDADPVAAVRVLSEAAGGGHLVLHATDPDVQAAFETAGVAGGLGATDGDYVAAVVNNAAANKADFYAERSLRYAVELRADGSAWATATVDIANTTPAQGLPSYVIGPNVEGATAGENRSLLSVYCAPGCRREGFRRSLGEGALREEDELGHPVFTTMVRLASGQRESVVLDWLVPDAWEPRHDGGDYRLTVRGQPTLRPTRLDVEVTAPDGLVVVGGGDGWVLDGGRARWEGEARGTRTFELRLERAAPASVVERLRRFLARPLSGG